MSLSRLLRSAYLLYFSKPAAERVLYQAIRGKLVRSIVELGPCLSGRTQRLLEVAKWRNTGSAIRYTGIDLFDSRASQGPTLKQAFAALQIPSIRVQLVPGEPDSTLRRVANSLTGTDLLIIAANQDRSALTRAWSWVPRMLHKDSLVFLEETSDSSKPARWRLVERKEIEHLAAHGGRNSRRAA